VQAIGVWSKVEADKHELRYTQRTVAVTKIQLPYLLVWFLLSLHVFKNKCRLIDAQNIIFYFCGYCSYIQH